MILDPEAAQHILHQADPGRYAQRVINAFLEVPFRLTLPQVLEAETTFQPTPEPVGRPPVPVSASSRVVRARDYSADIQILRDATHAGAPRGDVRDFLEYFGDRLTVLTRLLKRRREVANAVPIARAATAGRDVQLIGMVCEVSKRSKSGHRFVDLEDASGQCTLLVHQSRPDLVALADTLMQDEVIGVVAKTSRDGQLLIADQLVRPDVPLKPDRPRTDIPLHAAVLSDIHVGSKTFLADQFRRMLRWLHGEEGTHRERTIAAQIKYLVLPGDIVDGVGVFPGQEETLEIHDVLQQYRVLAHELEALPRHLSLVILPGNHDASRPNEPQPALDKEIQSYFAAHEATFVSNPSAFSLHGVHVLAYHGHSMVDFATSVPGQSLDRPIDIMKQMLQCRHVAPKYGGKTPISPEARDLLVIDPVPDLFITGHVHVAAVDRYKGVSLVNGGTWQSQTSYQRMHNLTPTPAVLPIVNLATLNGTLIDFSAPA